MRFNVKVLRLACIALADIKRTGTSPAASATKALEGVVLRRYQHKIPEMQLLLHKLQAIYDF
jgi:hypothetical protein